MENYKEMYLTLFNAITDEIERLKELQQKVEEMYINQEMPNRAFFNAQRTMNVETAMRFLFSSIMLSLQGNRKNASEWTN